MKKNQFSARHRMSEKHEFEQLFDNPKKYSAHSFIIYWKANDKAHPKLGITLKGRFSSVIRVKIKRVVREWFRLSKEKLGFKNINVVVRAREKMGKEFISKLGLDLKDVKL